MSSIHQSNYTADFKLFIDKLKSLKPGQKPLWGTMNAQQMVEHLIMSVQMSYGKLEVKCYTPDERIPVLKRFLTGDKPLPKNFNNPVLKDIDQTLMFPSLEIALSQLQNEVESYKVLFKENPEFISMNPTFGELNKDEWDIFHRKHFTHHFSQFGLL